MDKRIEVLEKLREAEDAVDKMIEEGAYGLEGKAQYEVLGALELMDRLLNELIAAYELMCIQKYAMKGGELVEG